MTSGQRTSDQQLIAARNFHDPYEAMTDDDFDAYVARLFDEPSGPTRSITVRMPEALLERLQRIASQRHMPYQRLMKRMLEEAVSGLERRGAAPSRRGQRQPAKRT